MERNKTRFHDTTQNGKKFKMYVLFISGTFHVIFLDLGWLWVAETMEGRTVDEVGLLWILDTDLCYISHKMVLLFFPLNIYKEIRKKKCFCIFFFFWNLPFLTLFSFLSEESRSSSASVFLQPEEVTLSRYIGVLMMDSLSFIFFRNIFISPSFLKEVLFDENSSSDFLLSFRTLWHFSTSFHFCCFERNVIC